MTGRHATRVVPEPGALATLEQMVKAAIDWESAWAGVRRTVDDSPEELATLEGQLRTLARSLPATHQVLAVWSGGSL